ncbi:hypothetical protein [Aureivirga sp. CE67]|uniref:hypothetical protein n=1 Tax=Aureivirga sp. CE67 TaxID=1788983 RepID=UPI0018CBC73E|nr:hypothetical protein [Aureivirga sp. CE67]
MKKSILLFCFLISIKSFSVHKNVLKNFNYGNVSGVYITAWNNDGTINDFDILVQLTAKLAEKVSYKDSIFLDFRDETATSKPRYSEIRKNNIAYDKKYGITFCNYSFKNINIWETLKLLEFAMKNDFKEQKRKVVRYDDFYEKTIVEYFGMTDKLISKIKNSEDSRNLKKLRKEKISFLDENGVQAYFQNETYYFTNQKMTFQTNSLEYLLTLNNGIMIFDTKSSFVYLNPEISVMNKIELDFYEELSDYPFYHYSFNIYNKRKLKEGVFIYKVMDSERNSFVFSEEKNEIIDFYFKPKNP